MKKIIYYLLVIVAVCSVASCSSEDEPGKIELSKDQSPEITLYSNNTNGEVRFNAAAPWSAWTSSISRAPEEIDWITLSITQGSAGEVTLAFTLENNTTGSDRTAYIIIVCEDDEIQIKITQITEEDPDENDNLFEDPLSMLYRNLASLWIRNGFRVSEIDGNVYTYTNPNNGSELVWQITGNLGYCTFDYYNAPTSIVAESSLGPKAVISLNKDAFASHLDYYDVNGGIFKSYDFEYIGPYLSKVIQYRDDSVYETSELTWFNGNVIEVRTTYSGGVTTMTPAYSNIENDCSLMLFDTQLWVDLDDIEFFYYCGLFGEATRHLISSTKAVEEDGGETYEFSATFNYSFDSNNCPIKIVYTEVESGDHPYTDIMDLSWTPR